MSYIDRVSMEQEKKFINLLEKKNKYAIPKYLKRAEYKFLQKQRNKDYKTVNKKFSKDFGDVMEQIYLLDSEEYYIGIHRTSSDPNKIMAEGLQYNDCSPNIHDHVQICKNFPFLLTQLMSANEYKGSTTSLIVKIPKKDIDPNFETDNERNPIYYVKDGHSYLKPNYIVGHVPVNNGNLNEFIINEVQMTDYSKVEGFVYDENINELLEQKRR